MKENIQACPFLLLFPLGPPVFPTPVVCPCPVDIPYGNAVRLPVKEVPFDIVFGSFEIPTFSRTLSGFPIAFVFVAVGISYFPISVPQAVVPMAGVNVTVLKCARAFPFWLLPFAVRSFVGLYFSVGQVADSRERFRILDFLSGVCGFWGW